MQMARENSGWGYDRIVGALSNLGHVVSDQTVGNILRRHGIAPAPKRSQTTTWKDFIRSHMDVLAGIDFFTVEVLTWKGLATYYVLFFITSGKPTGHHRRHDAAPDGSLDGADGSQCDRREHRMSASATLCSARPRHEVLRILPIDTDRRRCQATEAACAQPESECICRTLGTLRESRNACRN